MCFLHSLLLDLCNLNIYTWGCKGDKKNMNYNLILYIGIALILIGFVGFIICEIKISQLDRELYRQKQLDKSFKKAKANDDCQ